MKMCGMARNGVESAFRIDRHTSALQAPGLPAAPIDVFWMETDRCVGEGGDLSISGAARALPGRDRVAEHPGDTGDRHQECDVAMVGSQSASLALEGVDMTRELVEERHRRLEVDPPRYGDVARREHCPPAHPEQIADGTWDTVGEQRGVDAVLQPGALLDQVQPKACRSRSARPVGS